MDEEEERWKWKIFQDSVKKRSKSLNRDVSMFINRFAEKRRIVCYSMSKIKRLKAVFVISCLILFVFSVISISASVESTNNQASGVGIDLSRNTAINEFEYMTNPPNTDTNDDGLMDTLEDSIEQGISYLFSTRKDLQRKRGEFALFESSNRNMSDEVYRRINFGTPFVYHSLSFLENLHLKQSSKFKIMTMKNDAIAFMKQHKEIDNYNDPNVLGVDTGGAVWRYHYGFRDDMMWRTLYVDPDIDDTVMILLVSCQPYNVVSYIRYALHN